MYKKALVLLSSFSFSALIASSLPLLQQDTAKEWDPVTGEKLKNFPNTNFIAKLHNGTIRQYSSFYSVFSDLKNYGLLENSIYYFDIKKEKFLKLPSDFSYDQKQFEKDHNYKNNIKIKKYYKMGEKIYTQRCKNYQFEMDDFLEINELKYFIGSQKICGDLNEKYLHPLSLYLWDMKKLGLTQNKNIIVVHDNEKCPVCGMFVSKYPKWAAKLYYGERSYSFDGVKDLMKFYFHSSHFGNYPNTEKTKVTKFEVTDYYTQNAIDGFKAYYVIRSDVYGPMGNELIPFLNQSDAKSFMIDHDGKKILQFNEIDEKLPYKLDTNGR